MTEQTRAMLSTTEQVFQAVLQLGETSQPATRETVQVVTGLRQTVVDDRLRALADDGRLRRLTRGLYEIKEVFAPPRAMSATILEDGHVKVELADELWTLTPIEARRLARALGGYLEDDRGIEQSREHLRQAIDLAAEVKAMQRELKALRGMLSVDDGGQFPLGLDGAAQ